MKRDRAVEVAVEVEAMAAAAAAMAEVATVAVADAATAVNDAVVKRSPRRISKAPGSAQALF